MHRKFSVFFNVHYHQLSESKFLCKSFALFLHNKTYLNKRQVFNNS